jgi:hypothetical protein
MAFFQTKNPNLGKFWRVLRCKILAFFMNIWSILPPFWYILCSFGNFYGYLVYFSQFWSVVTRTIWQPCSEAGFTRL